MILLAVETLIGTIISWLRAPETKELSLAKAVQVDTCIPPALPGHRQALVKTVWRQSWFLQQFCRLSLFKRPHFATYITCKLVLVMLHMDQTAFKGESFRVLPAG